MTLYSREAKSIQRTFLLGATLALLAALGGCTTMSPTQSSTISPNAADPAIKSIEQLYAAWRVAVGASDIPAYLQALDPDVRLLPPGAAPIVGAASYGEFLVPVFAAANYRIEVVSPPKITLLGETALAEYEYIIHLDLKNPNEGVSEPGALTANRTKTRYFDVLRQQANGNWGVWHHTWSVMPE